MDNYYQVKKTELLSQLLILRLRIPKPSKYIWRKQCAHVDDFGISRILLGSSSRHVGQVTTKELEGGASGNQQISSRPSGHDRVT